MKIYQIKQATINEHIRNSVYKINEDDINNPIDSILSKYNININIKEPTAPSVHINEKLVYWEGETTSTLNIIEIINPECDFCRIVYQRINDFYNKLNKNVKIGYIIFSHESSLSHKALLFAQQKHKFKELLNDLILSNNRLDTATILNNMMKHNLDTIVFLKDLAF